MSHDVKPSDYDRANQLAKSAGVHVRWMIRRDMPEVLNIESLCFEFPWPEDEFIRVLRQRTCIGMVAEDYRTESVAGLMIYDLQKTCLKLLNFAVMPAFQKRGIGSAMVAKLLVKLSPGKRTQIIAHLRESNLDGQLFFSSQGFRAVEIVRGMYDQTDEDAYKMMYRLGNGF